ncbi:30S ribosome-binding factor RbfA [Acuticoccus sp. MNP-M23]|uniref:30S ribosome-binding factor RbfA n=1 Tax=Acuticoccus sp. MNP-M23 TaxID=3072793 RepID=UPI00281670C5|nr:30S ribosome-binding factor RbfA [Acuticoccus sp. MNP-M23]WMS42959.1 30S ribosome-binding factor RbfA [Acuticoccus sp. MNP-M23]
MQSQRQLRVGELVRHALSAILARGGTYDPDIDRQPITVPEVRMSPDLKIATVLVMPLGGENRDRIIKALARNAKPLRAALAREIRQLKYMPDLRFRLDTRFDDDDWMRSVLKDPIIAKDIAKGDDGTEGTDG